MLASSLGTNETRLALALLAIVVAGCGAILVALQADLTFWIDEWDFLLQRRELDAEALLDPHNEHIVVFSVLLYKALLGAFGMDSQLPFQLAQIAAALVAAVLLFVYVRRRIGAWAALAAVIPILFLGASWGNLLSAFQVAFFASMACGLGALLLFERGQRRTDPVVCGLLVAAVLWQTLGLTFVAGIGLGLALGAQRLRRSWVVLVPAAVYAAWWAGWGNRADTNLSLDNLLSSPGYIVDGFASSLSAFFGLTGTVESEALTIGRPMLAIAAVLALVRLHRLGKVPRGLAVALAIAVSFWLLTALNASVFREPTNGRYQYMGAVFIVMIAAELLRGVRIDRWALGAGFAIAIAAAVSGFSSLRDNSRFLAGVMERERAGLTALELARDTVDPGFLLTEQNSNAPFFDLVAAAPYLSAVDEYGSPAFSQAELVQAGEGARVTADEATAAALGVRLAPAIGGSSESGPCRRLEAGAVETVPESGLAFAARGDVTLRVRRFASESFPVDLGVLAAGEKASLVIPQDRAGLPWEVEVAGAGSALACEQPPLR